MEPRPPLVDQLLGPDAYVLRLPAAAGPAVRTGDLEQVLLISRGADAEFDLLQRMLTGFGVAVTRLDTDRLGAVRVTVDAAGGIVLDGRALRPTVTWVRRLAGAVSVAGPVDALSNNSWPVLVRQLEQCADAVLPGARVELPDQLRDAAQAGIRVPETVLTSDPAAAAAAMTGDRVVVKTLCAHFVEPSPGRLYGVFPQVLDRSATASRPAPGLPVVVQRYVPHEAEYRVYYVGGTLLTFEVRKPRPATPWLDPAAVRVRAVLPPAPVAEAVECLAELWGLRYGAFDLLVDRAGPVFLECNPDGDWRWFETRARSRSVSAAVALLVRSLHLSAGGTADQAVLRLLA